MTRPPEREELDALLDVVLPFAQDMLRKRGEFHPFGATMAASGQVNLAAAAAESANSQSLIDMLVAGMRQQAASGAIRASGICYDARLTDSRTGTVSDAIAVSLEHVAGDTVLVHMPYSKGRLSGWKFGDLTAGPGERRIFEGS